MPEFSLLGGGVNPGQAFMQGFQGARETIRQDGARNALSAYAQNPNDPQAMNALARFDPETAIAVRGQQQKYQQAQAEQQQKLVEEGRKVVGQAGLLVAGLHPTKRAAAWDEQIDILSQQFPSLAQMKGKYSEANLRAALAQAGIGDDYARMSQERYSYGPNGQMFMTPGYGQFNDGGIVATGEQQSQTAALENRYPNAPQYAQDAPVIADDAAYRSLAPGTRYIAPDGSRRIKGGAASQGAGGFRPSGG